MANTGTARTEFASALNQVAHERNLDPLVILDTIKQAILAAFKKDHPSDYSEDQIYDVELDAQSGEAMIFVVEGKKKTNITPPGFGRIAAQTARQVILQKIREAEKGAVVAEYEKRLGTITSGTIIRFVGSDIIVDLGRAEALFPVSEQVHSENYHLNQKLVFFLDSIRETLRGREVVVSRTNTGLISELFKREVPEVSSGAVEVKAIARDPGSRTKIAVYSHQSGVDPVGSCVGQKGVRVQAVITDLGGEKIDIVQYSEDVEKFVASALSPAAGLVVKIDAKKLIAQVTAPTDQLSLAIGREGQNAKLAGRLTGFHIDIKGAIETVEAKEDTASDARVSTDDSTTSSPASSTNDQP